MYYIREREIMEIDRMSIKKKEKKTETKIVRVTEAIARAIETTRGASRFEESRERAKTLAANRLHRSSSNSSRKQESVPES